MGWGGLLLLSVLVHVRLGCLGGGVCVCVLVCAPSCACVGCGGKIVQCTVREAGRACEVLTTQQRSNLSWRGRGGGGGEGKRMTYRALKLSLVDGFQAEC